MKPEELRGITIDHDKLEKLKKERWIKEPSGIYRCSVHNTYFDPDEYEFEPCWQCYEECKELI